MPENNSRRDRLGRLLDQAAWVDTDESRKHAKTIAKYGITPREWENIGRAQRWRCAGCEVFFRDGQGIKIDHCHETGKVRGLLCHACNITLGWAKDDPRRLRRLAHYVQSTARINSHNDGGRR